MKNRTHAIIAYLSSLTFTVTILATLSVTVAISIMESEISAVMQRNEVCRGTIISLFNRFGFNDLYNSPWFTSLLILFYINLLLCILRRIPITLQVLRPFSHSAIQQLPSGPRLKETLILRSIKPDFMEKVRSVLSADISDPSICYRDRSIIFHVQKGRYTHLGFYLAHGGFLFLLLGGLLSTSAYEGVLSIGEGETVDTLFVKEGKTRCVKKPGFALRLDSGVTAAHGGNPVPSHPKRIAFLRSGAVQKTEILEGYHTASYKGVRIALASARGDSDYHILIATTPKRAGGKTRVNRLKRHGFFRVPETGHLVRVKSIFSPSLSNVQNVPFKSPAIPSQNGNAPLSMYMVMLEVYGEDNKLLYTPAVFSRKNSCGQPWAKEYDFSLLDIQKIDRPGKDTSLKISYEPGGQLIWAGLSMAILGFSMMFYLSHKKVWVKLEERSGHFYLTLAGWSNRNPEPLKDHFKKIKELTYGDLSV